MTAVRLSEDQLEAVQAWLAKPAPQTMTLAGYAGTGKTTVIAELRKRVGRLTLVAAPTGKAALRLRQKGVNAETIHQIAYRFRGHDEDGDPEFTFTGVSRDEALLIIDEASMVNDRVYQDLIGGGYRMLFVGDHGQLPPVGGDPRIMEKPDTLLRVIHRQDDQGLLDFAHGLRTNTPVSRLEARGAVEKILLDPQDAVPGFSDALHGSDVTLCWRNSTRHYLNHLLLQLRGKLPDSLRFDPKSAVEVLRVLARTHDPVRFVCLRNNYRSKLFNGEQVEGRITDFRRETVWITLEDGREITSPIDGFRGDPRGTEFPPTMVLLDFGDCLTAHKAQGSEWPWVCVYDDYGRREDRDRWTYTAATRAQQRLTWCHR